VEARTTVVLVAGKGKVVLVMERARTSVVLVVGRGKDSSCPSGGNRQRQLSKLCEQAEAVVRVVGTGRGSCPSCAKRQRQQLS
jgi:hypothetical protein